MPGDDLLKGRFSQAHQFYHVTLCTDNRLAWFSDIHCGRIVVRQMRRLHEERKLDSIAWVVMPDHLHWLFQLGETKSLSNVIKDLKGRTAIELNAYLQRKGTIWQRGFYDHGYVKKRILKKFRVILSPTRYVLD